MNQIKFFLILSLLITLSACQIFGQKQNDKPVQQKIVVVKSPIEQWNEARPHLLAKLRTDARLRVQEMEDSSIYIQIRSLNSFVPRKNEISKEMHSILDHIIRSIEGFSLIKINVLGHTDNLGNAKRNMQTSKHRAEIVSRYLYENGVKQPIQHNGFGSERPIAKNNTAEGRAVNHRVEIIISLDEVNTQPIEQIQESTELTNLENSETLPQPEQDFDSHIPQALTDEKIKP